jgi:hypothetical protein
MRFGIQVTNFEIQIFETEIIRILELGTFLLEGHAPLPV